eukprot:2327069-Pyramimonas_sp.AAC.1
MHLNALPNNVGPESYGPHMRRHSYAPGRWQETDHEEAWKHMGEGRLQTYFVGVAAFCAAF